MQPNYDSVQYCTPALQCLRIIPARAHSDSASCFCNCVSSENQALAAEYSLLANKHVTFGMALSKALCRRRMHRLHRRACGIVDIYGVGWYGHQSHKRWQDDVSSTTKFGMELQAPQAWWWTQEEYWQLNTKCTCKPINISFNTLQYSTIQHNTLQYKTTALLYGNSNNNVCY